MSRPSSKRSLRSSASSAGGGALCLPSIERLLADNPRLHILTKDHADLISRFGVTLMPGPVSHAVPPELIRYLMRSVKRSHRTIETGGGHSTVAFAALAEHHTCITSDAENVELTREYIRRIGIPPEKVTFILESSATALPRLPLREELDFAFIDGNHAYPFPALDWHYIDQRLKVGGIVGLDNTEIRAVHEHCRFLEENQSYTLTERIANTVLGPVYGANFYTKVRDDGRETFRQPYNLKRAKKRTLRERVRDVVYRRRKVWPWD